MASELSLWVGIDWATETHQVCGINGSGRKLFEWSIKHTGEAIGEFCDRLLAEVEGRAERVVVAIETPRGAIIETLIERGVAVFSINPKQLDRFRDRHSVAGAKDDRLDAFVLADSLRTDAKLYRRVELGDPVLVELRELVRAHDELTAEALALGARLREQLHRYFPQFLGLGALHEEPWLWELWELSPLPAQVDHLQHGKVSAILKKYRVRRHSAEYVLETLRAQPLRVAPGVAEAASRHIALLLPRLRVTLEQSKACRVQIEELMSRLGRPAEAAEVAGASTELSGTKQKHRDVDILLSVPGLGMLTSAAMLAEAWVALRDRDYQSLRVQCGAAPVCQQTGKQRHTSRKYPPLVLMRHACNGRLRNTVFHWANVAMQCDARTREHYRRLRSAGHSHGRALRGVADRLLAMLTAMLKSGSLYNPARRPLPAAAAVPA